MMCGNGIRCAAKYLYDNRIVRTRDMKIETLAGIKELYCNTQDGAVSSVRVNMGAATVEAKPDAVYVDIGNPHRVLFVDNVETADVEGIGKEYPGYNNEFIRVVDSRTLQMRVWERGSGETLACGTGACASAAAAIQQGYCELNTEVKVQLPGGDLFIAVTDDTVFMTGEALLVYEGTVRL
jgi:carbamoyl-phosphate synthase large subunit